jgi:hypothetical protein
MEELPDRTLAEEKLFYERMGALLNDKMLLDVYNKFGIAAFRRSSVLEGFEAFLKSNRFIGTTCVEIGSFNGLTAFVLSRRFTRVVSVDIVDRDIKHQIKKFLGCDNVHFHTLSSHSPSQHKANILRDLEFDAAYVDGNHKDDTEFDFGLVQRCGRVLFHEYWEPQPAVKNLVDELAKSGRVVTQGKLALWTAS